MRKKVMGLFLGLSLLGGAAALFSPRAASAQQSDQPCINSCRQAYRACVNEAENPGGLNQCRKAYRDCLEACAG